MSHRSYDGSHRSRLNSSNVILYTPANLSKHRINTFRKDSNPLINVISDNGSDEGRESPKYHTQRIRTSNQAC